jgi:type I restriction enzyme M protein
MSEQADKALQDKVNKAVWNACDTFRGTVDPSIYKDYVLTMLFVKYLSDVWQDRVEQLQAQYNDQGLIDAMLKTERFQLPKKAQFTTLFEQRNTAGNGERIDIALSAIEEDNITKLGDVFQDITFNSNKLGEEKQKNDILKHLLEDFAANELDLRPSKVGNLDVIGNAYEFLIKSFASTSGKSAGEFYTPPEVSELIAELVAPQEGDEICDPACGSGSLLLKCANQITKAHAGSKKYALFGQEAIGSTWALAKMNMFLHSQDNHRLEWGDTIRNPKITEDDSKLKHFDIVVANPPFSLDKWGADIAEGSNDKFSRFGRGAPPKTKGDYAFILHMIETLNPAAGGKSGGKMGVVVPHGVLFRGSSEGKIRQKLVDEGLLRAVIGLPEKLFYGTGIPAAILIFSKQQINRDVLFIDASREFTSGKNQNQLSADNIKKVVDTFEKRQSVDKYAYLATLQEIKDNDYNLNIPRYVDTFEEEEEIDLMAVRKKRLELQGELAEIEKKMAGYLTELGYK